MLNQASGADTTVVNQTIADAQAFLAAHPLGSDPTNAQGRQTAIDLANTLDQFNNGLIGPGHCPDGAPTATRTNTPTASPTKTASPTATKTATPTETKTASPTATKTATPTETKTASPTATKTATPTKTATRTPTSTPTRPKLEITKKADAGSVNAGSPIGFTITVKNSGSAVAKNVVVNDPLPTGTGISWSISPAVAGCSITTNTLSCSLGDLNPGQSVSIHVVSPTTLGSCKQYNNTARASADNNSQVQASASVNVQCPACPTNVYMVNDMDLADSQFLKLDPVTLSITKLGPLYRDYDIEGIELQPGSYKLFAVAGSDNRHGLDGFLFEVSKTDGSLTVVGNTHYSELVGLSFRPDGTLWGWSEGNGLIRINPSTAASSVVLASSKNVEALAWSIDGTKLYAAAGKNLYVYNPATNQLTQLASNLPGATEALEMRPDGLLIGGVNDSTKLFVYDVVAKQVVTSKAINISPYNDLESIAWPECLAPPAAKASVTQRVAYTLHDMLLGRDRTAGILRRS